MDTWLRTVEYQFALRGLTDGRQQFLWARCALRGAARDFLTFEAQNVADMVSLAQTLKRRFRHILSQYQISADLQNLQMRSGDFSGYLRKFNSLRSQLTSALTEPNLSF